MKDYQLEICKNLQHDLKELGGQEWDIDTVFNFWSEWSRMCAAGFLRYEKGDFDQLEWVIDVMWNTNFNQEEDSNGKNI